MGRGRTDGNRQHIRLSCERLSSRSNLSQQMVHVLNLGQSMPAGISA